MRIYIASPYTGDEAINVRNACHVADILVERGHVPFIPHLSHLWQLISPKSYSFWRTYTATFIIDWADAIFRLQGESTGVDSEVKLAKELGIPVYYNIYDIPTANFVESMPSD